MESNFEWVSQPVKENKWLNIIAVIGILLFIGGSVIWIGILGIPLGVLIAVLTLHSYFLPTKYTVDEISITVTYMFQKKSYDWKYFKTYYMDDKGILLSPFASPSRLENFRGLYVRYGNRKEEIKEIISKRIQEQ